MLAHHFILGMNCIYLQSHYGITEKNVLGLLFHCEHCSLAVALPKYLLLDGIIKGYLLSLAGQCVIIASSDLGITRPPIFPR